MILTLIRIMWHVPLAAVHTMESNALQHTNANCHFANEQPMHHITVESWTTDTRCNTGEMIITNERYVMTEIENSMYAVQMVLTIKQLQKSDFGGYKCISKNSIGGIEATIRLYGKFQFKSKLNSSSN